MDQSVLDEIIFELIAGENHCIDTFTIRRIDDGARCIETRATHRVSGASDVTRLLSDLPIRRM